MRLSELGILTKPVKNVDTPLGKDKDVRLMNFSLWSCLGFAWQTRNKEHSKVLYMGQRPAEKAVSDVHDEEGGRRSPSMKEEKKGGDEKLITALVTYTD